MKSYLNIVAELKEPRIAGIEAVRLPQPGAVLESAVTRCQNHLADTPASTLPCKVVVVLQSSQTKAIFQSLLGGCGSSGEDVVNIIDRQSHVCAAVLRHTLLDWNKVLPLQEY